METIQRQICLEDFKNRFKCKHHAHDGSGITSNVDIWGMIPTNITVLPNNEVYKMKDTLPLVCGLYQDGAGRYGWETFPRTLEYNTFVKWLYFLEEYERTSTYFKKIGNKWVEFNDDIEILLLPDDTAPTYNYYTSIEDVKDAENCTIIGINASADTFNKTFIIDNERYERHFMKLSEDVFNGKCNYTLQYFNLPCYLSTDIDVIGQYQPLGKLWDPYKKYYIGEVVWWSDDTGEIVPYELIFNSNKIDKYVQQTDWGIYYKPSILSDGSFEFDTDVWVRYRENGNNESTLVTGVTVESRLEQVRRTKVSVDDEGEILPFIINETTTASTIDNQTSANTIYYNTELVFKYGIANTIITNDNKYNDLINKIEIKVDNLSAIIYNSQNSGLTITNIFSDIIDIDSIEDGKVLCSGKISFDYTIGAIEGISDSGINYNEEYDFNLISKKYGVTLDSDPVSTLKKNEHFFVYIDIKYDNNIVSIYSDDRKITENKRLSDINYKVVKEKDKAPIVKDDTLLGIEDIYKDFDINVDRGLTHSAFERLHILGEVKTFEDLENYRNNLFKL